MTNLINDKDKCHKINPKKLHSNSKSNNITDLSKAKANNNFNKIASNSKDQDSSNNTANNNASRDRDITSKDTINQDITNKGITSNEIIKDIKVDSNKEAAVEVATNKDNKATNPVNNKTSDSQPQTKTKVKVKANKVSVYRINNKDQE